MNFKEITDTDKVYPGEYLLYTPSNQIVLCGAYNRKEGFVRALHAGRYLEDKIEHFKKIVLSKKERKERKMVKCKKCGKG
jgi:hypothetical protein